MPAIVANKNQNTITVRATAPLVAIMERIIEANDRPRAEVIVDVQILEVNRARAKQFGLDLSNYSVTGIFSPEVRPTDGDDDGGRRRRRRSTSTRSRAGISAADFYLAVPTAVVRFLESDSQTKLVAKPQLRGREGKKITLNLGDEFPVPSTTFGSLGGAGSVATQPISSFNYQPVGIIVNMTPRVTFDGDIVLELTVESSTLGQDVNIAGQNLPSFGSRKVETTLRLRDGESTLLAGSAARGRAPVAHGLPGLDAPARLQAAVREQRHCRRADRHRDAADAADRPHARADAGGREPGLHRLAAEPGPDRAAAAHRGAGRPAEEPAAPRAAGRDRAAHADATRGHAAAARHRARASRCRRRRRRRRKATPPLLQPEPAPTTPRPSRRSTRPRPTPCGWS